MSVRLSTAQVEDVELRIFEPPRFFEALLRGRSFLEAPDITARICGICPVAYQTSAVNAMEDALRGRHPGADPPAAPPALLRRMDREPRAARLHAPRARLPRLRRRRARWRASIARGRARARAEEDRQRRAGADRRPRDPPDQRPRRRLLSCADTRRAAARSSSRSSAHARLRSKRCAGRPASSFRSATFEASSSRSREPDDVRDRRRPDRLRPRPRHRTRRLRRALRRRARRAIERAPLPPLGRRRSTCAGPLLVTPRLRPADAAGPRGRT